MKTNLKPTKELSYKLLEKAILIDRMPNGYLPVYEVMAENNYYYYTFDKNQKIVKRKTHSSDQVCLTLYPFPRMQIIKSISKILDSANPKKVKFNKIPSPTSFHPKDEMILMVSTDIFQKYSKNVFLYPIVENPGLSKDLGYLISRNCFCISEGNIRIKLGQNTYMYNERKKERNILLAKRNGNNVNLIYKVDFKN